MIHYIYRVGESMNNKVSLLILLTLTLSSCDVINKNNNSSESSSVIISSEESSCSSSKVDYSSMSILSLNSDSCSSGLFKYSTGSFGDFYQGYRFDFYRAYKKNNELLRLLPYISINSVEGLNSAFYNRNKIDGIKKIDITYSTNINGNKPILKLGVNRFYTQQIEFELSEEISTFSYEVETDDIRYFSIETSSTLLSIISIDIYYLDNFSYGDEDKKRANEGYYRINLETLNKDVLVPGETKVNIPTSIIVSESLDENTYNISETKEYTYYTYDYISENRSLAKEASLVEPEDVANYFITFGTYPVNYVDKKNYNSAYSIFGEDTRCVSKYSRTDGYATSVPYLSGSDNKPSYYECDIALDENYSSGNRGVGRLVVWEYGFDENKGAKGYSSSPVCVYTDDHYATFREYLNHGQFGNAFDAESERTYYRWYRPITLTLK